MVFPIWGGDHAEGKWRDRSCIQQVAFDDDIWVRVDAEGGRQGYGWRLPGIFVEITRLDGWC